MDNDELGRVGALESHDVPPRFHPDEPLSRLWVEPGTASGGERAYAVERDRCLGTAFELGELWRRLGACEWHVRDTFATEARLYVTVGASDAVRRRPASDAGLAMIEQILVGQSSKAVAIDRRVSDSTVALAVKKRLQLMGLTCKVRAMPLILAMAARAACGRLRAPLFGRIASLSGDSQFEEWVISVAHPDFRFPKRLSSAERAVLSHALAGKTYVQIATARETSLRTVANQLASIFRKLGVSGYGQTLDLLLSRTFDTEEVGPEARPWSPSLKSSPSSLLRALPPPH